uniref:Solute carrier family 25, member 34/35 n=1 Tax=Kwoniella pini CBS 10737 TaxID=1296096 RepID=A0A1B9HTQ3_9TREE|nr:solute carrier family 25, member 34/35 [Kwoniella pini CBS 10737]OCF46647.1 solute carrier family 25, member 34/35 [Kwoniella pini CBS 10737]
MSSSSSSNSNSSIIKPNTVPVPTPTKTVGAPLTLLESFLCGGLAGCGAVTISNIPETMKTRLQLQGELQRHNPSAPKIYKNVFDVFVKTWKNEGIRGLQRGLIPAYGYQTLLNGSRLGFYEPIRQNLNKLIGKKPTQGVVSTAIAAGAITGCIGAALGSPLFLVKARIQAYSPAFPVGAQHYYKGSYDALSTIVKSDGVLGLWRGVNTAILRTAMGSSVQLPSYNLGKHYLTKWGMKDDSFWTFFLASSLSGVCVCIMMQPADTALTRMYNQNTVKDPITGKVRGALYQSPIDCLWKTFKAEGIAGWYKGTTAHFLRITPHTICTLVFNEVSSSFVL